MCDALTIIDHGKLVFSGTVEALGEYMNGNAPVVIRLASDAGMETVQRATALIRQQPGVTGVGREAENTLTVALEGGDAEAAQLLRALSASAPVVDFHRAPLNLEKVFMEVTKDE